MKYPKKSNFLVYKDIGNDTYLIEEHFIGNIFQMQGKYVRLLQALDGNTDPYDLAPDMESDEVDELLEQFDDNMLLRDWNRFLGIGLGSFLFALWIPKSIPAFIRRIAKMVNWMLMYLSIPILILGGCMYHYAYYHQRSPYADYNFWIVYIGCLLICLVLHELAHACASLTYGGEIFEIGIMMHVFLPGAYVMTNYDCVKNRFKRAQICAAGIEMHMFLMGLSLCLKILPFIPDGVVEIMVLNNFFLGLVNLSLIEGIDGSRVLSEMFGDSNLFEHARELIKNRKRKRALKEKGINGRAVVLTSYLLSFMQILLPILLVMNVVEIVISFIV